MPVPESVVQLVERFQRNLQAYRSGQYNETQLRREFIDPLFKALGWDVDNEQGYAEAYKDVVHEDAVRVGGATKAPDYCFRIGGTRKFFLEAKKPSVNLKGDISPAFQVRRYAWSAKLPLSILTDFEEFAVYDCRIEPRKTDKASTARTLYLTYDEYIPRWEEISEIFSRQAVLKGSFDKYAETTRRKRGTAEVDAAFLKEIESWRELLARNLALRNPALSRRELNFAVQRTIDRIIFLRICEDRGIEPYGQLMALQNGSQAYQRLCQIFHRADERYNSGLFHFREERGRTQPPDDLTLALELDDKPLRDIIKRLYYPDSPYEFYVLPADILGQVYEQFLGKVIRLTPGHRAVIEDKPEVKKAGGVYYTPTYIVDYIVENTVGKLLDGKTPRGAEKLRILDPACGSGSFLIGAYQYLLDWHRDWYVNDNHKKWAKGKAARLYQGMGGDWRLTTAERKRILLNNIYGVDIDPQAVEVTKLSLLLKVLEGENQQTLATQLQFFRERALPDLGSNIKCGNSLIGTDFYDNQQMNLFDEEERLRINAFDWEAEFPDIMKVGGFDAVIGNPPWGASFNENELAYLRKNHRRVIARMIDSYIYFIDRSDKLAKEAGFVGFIIPSTVLNQVDGRPIRQMLLDRGLSALLSLGSGIFGKRVLNTSTILVSRRQNDLHLFTLADLSKVPPQNRQEAIAESYEADWQEWRNLVLRDPHLTFFVGNIGDIALLDRMRCQHTTLESILQGRIQRGVSPDVVAAHVISASEAESACIEGDLLRASISGSKIKRYEPWECDQYIIYTDSKTQIENFPNAARYLEQFKHLNTCKEVKQGKHPWWRLHRSRDPVIFESPKFIGLTTARAIELIYDEGSSLCVTDAMYVFRLKPGHDPWACMAILQSKVFLFLYLVANQGESRVIPQVKATKLMSLPYPTARTPSTDTENLSLYTQRMLDLHRQKRVAKTAHEKTALQRQIDATDRQIDQLVYDLYELTDEEIAIVESHQR